MPLHLQGESAAHEGDEDHAVDADVVGEQQRLAEEIPQDDIGRDRDRHEDDTDPREPSAP
jgi:hypothetical protein